MEQPVGKRLQPQPSGRFALDHFRKGYEPAGVEAVRARHVGRVTQRDGFRHRNTATGNERRRQSGACKGSQ